MSDLLVHVILDGPPAGHTGATDQDSVIMRIVSAPAMGARYNQLFSFRRPPQLAVDRETTIKEVNDAVRSRFDASRTFSSPACRQLQQHGGSLYRELCHSSRQIPALVQQIEFLRRKLLLLLQFGDGVGDLASCYWEALYDEEAERFLVHGGTIARYIPAGRAPAAPSGQLRVLVAISTYGTGGTVDEELSRFAQEDLDGLHRSLEGLQAKGIVGHVEVLKNPSQTELADALRMNVNLLHFFGHGGVDPDHGEYLILRGPGRESRGRHAYVSTLRNIFEPADTPELRLVVINACRLEEQAALGARLVGSFGIPGVITMRATIGTQVIADRHGFTETLYRHIAGGEAVHEAYRAALGSILYASPVETFVPTLTLGTTEPLILVDPAQPATTQVRMENQQRRPPIEEMVRSIGDAWSRLDHEGLAAALNTARAHVQDPQILEVIREVFEGVKREIERLSTAHQWPLALRCASTLNTVAESLAPDRQQESERLAKEIHAAIEKELQSLRSSAFTDNAQGKWPDVVRSAERYLELKPDDSEIKQLLAEARECVSLDQNIVTVDEKAQTGTASAQLENLLKAGDIGKAEALFMSKRQQLSVEQAGVFNRQILIGKANQSMQKGDWQTARRAAQDLRHIDPANAEAAGILSDVLLEDAATFLRAGENDKAEDKCREAANLAPQSARVIQFRRSMYGDRIRKLQGRRDWPEVRRLSKQVLADPLLIPIHSLARDWEREASGYEKLWDQIRIVS